MNPPAGLFTDEIKLDHQKWLMSPAYRQAVQVILAEAYQPGAVVLLTIAHEADESCCRVMAGDPFKRPA